MQGTPEELFENEELLNFFLPILRSDFQIAEENELTEISAVKSPILALMGDQEDNMKEINNWRKYSKSDFGSYILLGGHFLFTLILKRSQPKS